jgi:hypothetical protein
MKTKLTLFALAGLLALSLAPTANAQGGFSLSFGKHKRGKHVGFSLNVPLGHGHHRHQRHHRHHRHRHVHVHTCRQWVAGRVEIVHDRVWVPGCSRQIWVDPVYRTDYDACGHPVQVLVAPGHYDTVTAPGRFEVRERRVQRPGRWIYRCGH